MVIFYPSLDVISKFKVPPTHGERALLTFLKDHLDDSYEVYFNPYLNGDRPDVIIMRKDGGVIIIEVKDWRLNNYEIDNKKHWHVIKPTVNSNTGRIKESSHIKSPIEQVLKYKNNLYDLHVDKLYEMQINNPKLFNVVTCAVYFHCATHNEIEDKLVRPFQDNKRYINFLHYNVELLGSDDLVSDRFNKLLAKHYMTDNRHSYYFSTELYNNFHRLLSPSIHLLSQGVPCHYTERQKDIIYNDKNMEQRVKGVFGSGKTTVMVARAVQAYKRAMARNVYPRILILTYNITLKNFIHDKLKRVDEKFDLNNFIIINYHQFCNSELNNLGIIVEPPTEEELDKLMVKNGAPRDAKEYEKLHQKVISTYFETHYYGNIQLFESHKDQIKKYDAVFIDEIQDYHRSWMDIVKRFYRDPDGDYVLFGDVKQNIYDNPTENKDVITNVLGRPIELKRCFRSFNKISDLAKAFQHNIFKDKYDYDSMENGEDNDDFFGQELKKDGYLNYMYIENKCASNIITLYNIIRGNIENKERNTSSNDITIIGFTITLLRMFDLYYRHSSHESTTTMFETIEYMYFVQQKLHDEKSGPNWFGNIRKELERKLFPNKQIVSDTDVITIKKKIAKLFALYDLYKQFPQF